MSIARDFCGLSNRCIGHRLGHADGATVGKRFAQLRRDADQVRCIQKAASKLIKHPIDNCKACPLGLTPRLNDCAELPLLTHELNEARYTAFQGDRVKLNSLPNSFERIANTFYYPQALKIQSTRLPIETNLSDGDGSMPVPEVH